MTDRWTVAALAEQERLGDPEADAVIGALFDTEGADAASGLLRTFVSNDQPLPGDLAPPVRDYIDRARPLPAWAEPARIHAGQQVFQRWGPQAGVCLWCQVLAEGYMNWRLSHVIFLSGRMESDLNRRAMETFQFLLDVMTPGGLDPGGDGHGIASALRVRLMHAAIRSLVKQRAAETSMGGTLKVWDEAWGEPASQVDLAVTLMGFSALVIDGLSKLGIRLSESDAEDYFHAWRVVGYYMGIDEGAMPRTLTEGRELYEASRQAYYRATPAGQALEVALVRTLEELAPLPMRGLPRQFIRFLVGDAYSDLLGVPKIPRWRRFLFRVGGRIHRRTFGILSRTDFPDLAAPFHRAMMERYLRRERGGERAPFAIPTELRAAFGGEE